MMYRLAGGNHVIALQAFRVAHACFRCSECLRFGYGKSMRGTGRNAGPFFLDERWLATTSTLG